LITETIPQTVLFPDLFDRPLVATFDQPHASSDGGAVLLKAAERRYGLIDGFAQCLVDERQSGKIRHTLADLLAQRIFGLACGHADANDADRLADDPIHKLLLGRDPVAGDSLPSQPTISRFENRVGVRELYTMGRELATSVIERHQRRLRGRARRITIDLDPTDDPTHGAQQLTFFNGHYDCWCYLPLLAFLTFDDESEQYLCAAMLRPGNVLSGPALFTAADLSMYALVLSHVGPELMAVTANFNMNFPAKAKPGDIIGEGRMLKLGRRLAGMEVLLYSSNGREVCIHSIGPGDMFGEIAVLDGEPRSASIVASSDLVIAAMRAKDFMACVESSPAAGIWLARRLSAGMRRLTEQVFELSALNVQTRIHCELLRMAQKGEPCSGGIEVRPAPTHAELANRIGTHREAVTREMQVLSKGKIIRHGRRSLMIIDLARLEQAARR